MAASSFLLSLLSIAFVARSSAALCIPSEPYVDCNFHSLSSPQWVELSSNSAALTAAWKAAFAQAPEFPTEQFAGRGLVITATKLDLVNVPVLLKALQAEGFNLPVEIWYSGEVSSDIMDSLMASYGKLLIKNVANYASDADLQSTITSQGEHGFQAKPLAILYSAFEEVLFLDADNIPMADPSALFRSSQYQTTGALFWPDFWRTATKNPIWSILGVSPQGQEQESGQILVDKRRTWGALNLAFFFAKDNTFQKMINGDKEAFRLAFLATGTPFAMVETPVAAAGAETYSGEFCGHTMVQHDPTGVPLFLHHNSLKHGAAVTWQLMKAVPAGKGFSVVPLPPATMNGEPVSCLDLEGADVIVIPEPFSAFESSFAQLQAAADPALKRVSQNEFTAVSLATARKLLQGNGSFTVPADGSTCPAGANYCYSSGGGILTCCLSTCSGVYANPDPVTGDAQQFCALPGGGVDNPGTPVATTPSPSTLAGGLPPDANGNCGQINFRQPCYPAGAPFPSVCCPDIGFQCVNTDTSTPFCGSIPSS
jgi:alpha 1,2-mannosyltransferase